MDEPKKPRRKKAAPKILHCSFCEKSQHEVRKLIAKGNDFANPSLLICDECIDMCNDIIGEEGLQAAKGNPALLLDFLKHQHATTRKMLDRIVEAMQLQAELINPNHKTKH